MYINIIYYVLLLYMYILNNICSIYKGQNCKCLEHTLPGRGTVRKSVFWEPSEEGESRGHVGTVAVGARRACRPW